jgi:hypothetical protein
MDAAMNRARRQHPVSVGGVPSQPFDPSNHGMSDEMVSRTRWHAEKILNKDPNPPLWSDGSIKYKKAGRSKAAKADAKAADSDRVARLQEAGIDAKPAKTGPKAGTKKSKAERAARKAHLIETGRWPER